MLILLAKNATPYYRYTMNRRHRSFLRTLLLLLVAVGPLQAQAVFACAMMETVVHDECCCDDRRVADNCANTACESAPGHGDGPCCERTVEVSAHQEAGKSAPVVQQVEVRSDVDPPHVLASSIDALTSPLPRLGPGASSRLAATGPSGSDTYLVTQRLRL